MAHLKNKAWAKNKSWANHPHHLLYRGRITSWFILGSGSILQMDYDVILPFIKCYENVDLFYA